MSLFNEIILHLSCIEQALAEMDSDLNLSIQNNHDHTKVSLGVRRSTYFKKHVFSIDKITHGEGARQEKCAQFTHEFGVEQSHFMTLSLEDASAQEFEGFLEDMYDCIAESIDVSSEALMDKVSGQHVNNPKVVSRLNFENLPQGERVFERPEDSAFKRDNIIPQPSPFT